MSYVDIRFPPVIGLCGLAGSGKSTLANMLEGAVGYRVLPFAAPLKSAAAVIFNLTHDQLYGEQKNAVDPRYGLTPRRILQLLGTEVVRTIHKDAWVIRWRDEAQKALKAGFHVVVDDVRFQNEAIVVLEMKGVVWMVERPEQIGFVKVKCRRKGELTNGEETHASEQPDSLKQYISNTISNTGTKEELWKMLKEGLNAFRQQG